MKTDHVKRWMALLVIYIFNKFPIKHNKIFLFSYYGAQFGCNPKYITNYIINHYPKDTFDLVWAFNDPALKGNSDHFRKVKTMSLRYFYELCTAKVVITNFRTTDLFVKRKEQYYIQTWHSSLRLKQIEKDAASVLPASYVQMAKKDSLKCDLLLSGCHFSTNIFARSFWYKGEIFKHGTPRNDILLQVNSQMRKEILKKLKIPSDTKILLYAPTFRENDSSSVYHLNYSKLIEKLTSTFSGKWVVLVKLHPHFISQASVITNRDDVLNVTTYDDIQELLAVADVLITDYSSLMFDYSLTNRPCFLYVPDLKDYTTKERKLYFNLIELPFICATSNDDLLVKMDQYKSEQYKKEVKDFLSDIGSYENGKASKNLLKRIEEVCFDEGRDDETYEAV